MTFIVPPPSPTRTRVSLQISEILELTFRLVVWLSFTIEGQHLSAFRLESGISSHISKFVHVTHFSLTTYAEILNPFPHEHTNWLLSGYSTIKRCPLCYWGLLLYRFCRKVSSVKVVVLHVSSFCLLAKFVPGHIVCLCPKFHTNVCKILKTLLLQV